MSRRYRPRDLSQLFSAWAAENEWISNVIFGKQPSKIVKSWKFAKSYKINFYAWSLLKMCVVHTQSLQSAIKISPNRLLFQRSHDGQYIFGERRVRLNYLNNNKKKKIENKLSAFLPPADFQWSWEINKHRSVVTRFLFVWMKFKRQKKTHLIK